MDRPSARVLIRTVYICSHCEVALRLKVADTFPTECPNCSAVFDHTHKGEMDKVEESIVSLKTAH